MKNQRFFTFYLSSIASIACDTAWGLICLIISCGTWRIGKSGEMAQKMYKLSFVLENINEYKWSNALYLPEDEAWDMNTEGLIWDPNDIEDDSEEVPLVARESHLIWALNIQDIQDIVYNAKQQKERISVDELLEAYLYYYDNDAYINWL